MPKFVARCLEEIGLEGRCGIPLKDMFALVDPANDVVYRKYAWRVLRTMDGHLQFHHMERSQSSVVETRHEGEAGDDTERIDKQKDMEETQKSHRPQQTTTAESAPENLSSPMSSPPRRKRKWSTTLMTSPESGEEETQPPIPEKSAGKKKSKQKLEPVVPSARRNASKRQRKLLSNGGNTGPSRKETGASRRRTSIKRERRGSAGVDREERSDVDQGGKEVGIVQESQPEQREQDSAIAKRSKPRRSEDGQDPEGIEWIYRSPRGFVLGEQVGVSDLSYEDAMIDAPEGVLGIVACEELRLKYLGVVDPTSMDTISPQFDLLEMIGRAREQGENAAILTNSNVFGDSRKLHYLLDVLIAGNYVEKNMVTADQRRFNILHLTRFADKFHPSMVSPTATMERESFPKQFVPQVIAEMLIARGERTCVFADIGRELGYDKRQQEKLRKYFFHQMHVNRNFPLELFMARCNTGAEYKGRKLWCIRLRHAPSRGKDRSSDIFEPVDPPPTVTTGPVIERGIMEQMFTSIQNRKQSGATIPEIRDLLGVPTFKLPYKLAQGLISNYNLSVEQVVVGKSTMYRMYVPGEDPPASQSEQIGNERTEKKQETGAHDSVATSFQPSTMIGAARGVLVASTAERRKEFMLERIRRDKIVSVHQLRTGLIAMERDPSAGGSEFGTIDIRSVRRILEDLEAAKMIVTMDITLPPKRVLQRSDRVVRCVALPGFQRDRAAIATFVDGYVEEQQKKYMSNLGQHDDDDVVVVSDRRRGLKASVQDETREVVKYTAASYKIARVNLVKLTKQNRKLGMFIGTLYRCRMLHILLWEKIDYLRQKSERMGAVDESGHVLEAQEDQASTAQHGTGSVVFALKEVLELLDVKEYIQLAGINELLTETEENKVRMAIVRGDSWEVLPGQTQQKIRGCEADRFSRILRVLIELRLIQVVNDSSLGLLNVFRSSDDFESMVSNVAFATLSGGLFKVNERARITVTCGDKVLKQLPTKQSFVYAASFSGKSRSDHFFGRVPLEFQFKGGECAKEYWKALRFLSLEGARLGTGANDADSVSINVDSELIRAAPLKDHNIYTLRVWVPHGMANPGRSSAKAKAEEAVAEPMQFLKRKRFQNNPAMLSRDLKKSKNGSKEIEPRRVPLTEDTEAGVSKFRRLVATKQSLRASKWTLEEDMKLMDAYVDEMSCQWFIEIPLALQKKDERLAFRNTSLERTRISWKGLGKTLGKKSTDCYLRVRELMTAPAVRARVESTKASITQMKNPGGKFHEELAVMKQPRLAALLTRALQILLHERASYYPVLADMLISQWNEGEVKLVWRYLWLAGLITRTRNPNDGDQKERGFCIHSRVHEMKSLNIAHYPMEVFCEAAEYVSFVQENVKEAAMLEAEEEGSSEESEGFFEHELEPNAGAGQTAVELSSMVLSVSEMIPEYVEPDGDRRAVDSDEAKKAMAVKGFAGHLAKCCGGAVPEDFLKDYWTVKSRAHVFVDEGNHEMITDRAKNLEAFSTCPALQEEYVFGVLMRTTERKKSDVDVSASVIGALDGASSNGLSFDELMEKIQAKECAEQRGGKHRSSVPPVNEHYVMREVDLLVRQGRVIEVNGYAQARFVLKEYGDIWMLNPYRISNKSTQEKMHFMFDKEQAVVTRPWHLLDGSVNTKVELVLKRKVVNIIMCSPGIQDHVLHRKMHKLLSIQSLRSLVEELILDEIVYARLARGAAHKPSSIFDSSSRKRPRVDEQSMAAIAPGDLRFINTAQDEVHYFPSINCVELLGAAACDADLRRNW